MNITKTNVDDLNAVIKLHITKEDYEQRVNDTLKDYRKKAKIDGFRSGKVPMGIVKKMYGNAVLVDEINKLISDNLIKYIYDNKINVLGEPLPNETDQKPIDWENDEEFEFAYDIAVAPEFTVKMSKREKLNYYKIKVSEEMIDNRVDHNTRVYGKNELTETIEEGKEMLRGSMVQVDEEGKEVEGGVSNENTTISLEYMKDDEIREGFKGAKVGDAIVFNPSVAYPNKADYASMLAISKEEAENLTADFRFVITEINKFTSAEINQELFDKVYGEGTVSTVEEFRAKVKSEIEDYLVNDSEYKFTIDAKEKLINKVGIELPEAFLKRWIVASNKEMTEEMVEKDFANYADDIRWQLIKSKIIEENELKVEEEDVKELAKQHAKMQMQQYGLTNIPEEHLEGFAAKILENENERKQLIEKARENKVLACVKESIKIEEKEVEVEEFNKMFE